MRAQSKNMYLEQVILGEVFFLKRKIFNYSHSVVSLCLAEGLLHLAVYIRNRSLSALL